MYHHYYYYQPFNLVGFTLQVLFLFLIVWLGWVLISKLLKHNNEPEEKEKSENKCLEIIKERYAKGEIDKKEFESLKKDLE